VFFNFDDHNLLITDFVLFLGCDFHKLLKSFTKFYYIYKDLLFIYNSTSSKSNDNQKVIFLISVSIRILLKKNIKFKSETSKTYYI